jgi:hypothetical protein
MDLQDLTNLFSLRDLRFRPMSVRTGGRSAKGLSHNITTALFAFLLVNGSATAVAQNGTFPLEPPDTTSPRGALFNLIDNVDEASRVLDAASRDYRATPGLFKNDAVLAQEACAKALLRQAAAHVVNCRREGMAVFSCSYSNDQNLSAPASVGAFFCLDDPALSSCSVMPPILCLTSSR